MNRKMFICLFLTLTITQGLYSQDKDLSGDGKDVAQYLTDDPSESGIIYEEVASRGKHKKTGFFSNRVLFQTLLADPKKIHHSTGARFKDSTWNAYEYTSSGERTGVIGTEHTFWSVSLGDRLPLYLIDFGMSHQLQLEIEGGFWGIFSMVEYGNPTNYSTLMLNADYRIGVPITYSYNDFSFKFSFFHESTHLGDEFMKAAIQAGVFQLSDRKNPSTEVLDLYVSYNIIKEIRIYSGIGVHLTYHPSYPVKPLYFEYGIEFRPFDRWDIYSQFMMQLFAAFHMRTVEDLRWDPDLSIVLGLEMIPTGDETRRRIRLYGEYHYGYSYEGQFSKNKTDYFNIILAFGF